MNFTIFLFSRKNEKTPETLDFTGFSGGVFGVPEVIRTPDLPLRRRSLYPAELLVHTLLFYPNFSCLSRKYVTFFACEGIYCQAALWKEGEPMYSCDDPHADLDDLIFEKGDGGPSER